MFSDFSITSLQQFVEKEKQVTDGDVGSIFLEKLITKACHMLIMSFFCIILVFLKCWFICKAVLYNTMLKNLSFF